MKKRFISMLLSLCMVLSVCIFLQISASAEVGGKCGDNLTYILDDEGTLTISGNGEMWNYGYNGNAPEKDASIWYQNGKNVVKVIIKQGVTTIGERAFDNSSLNFPQLKTVSTPNSVETIEDNAFYFCSALTNITFQDGLKSIGESAFEMSGLEYIYLPNSLQELKEKAFFQCEKLTTADITMRSTINNEFPEHNLKAIPTAAFAHCTSLENLTIPGSVQTIADSAFLNCVSLKEIECWGANNSSFLEINANNEAFLSSPITCDNGSFKYTIENDSVTILEKSAIANISDRLIIPNQLSRYPVKKIGDHAFDYGDFKELIISEGVAEIGMASFKSCKQLESVHLPNTITTINAGAFDGCKKLSNIKLPNSLISCGHDIFKDCNGLEHIVIPNSITVIREGMFDSCENLSSVVIPDSIKQIEWWAFYSCKNLKDVYFTGTQEQWNMIEIDWYNTGISQATIHCNYEIAEEPPVIIPYSISISAPTNSYAGTYYTFEATFDVMPTSAFLQFDSPADGWTWFSDEYCSTNPVFNIPTDEIVEKDGKYVYQTSFVIYSSGNTSDSYNRQVRVAADINGTRQYSEGAKFVVQPTPAKPKNTIGYLYEQTSNPSDDTIAPEIKDVEVTKSNGKYRLTIKDITAENEDWVFFYWQTDNGEFEKVADDFKTVDLTVSGDANVTVTMGDGCGYITTKTIEIN